MLIFTGVRPAARAASMPASTAASGARASLIAVKTAGSSASKLTVTRLRPASRKARALRAKSVPFVVRARSSISGIAAICATSSSS
jgi:hypothetical protein